MYNFGSDHRGLRCKTKSFAFRVCFIFNILYAAAEQIKKISRPTAVGLGGLERLHGDAGGRTRAVLDHDRLAETDGDLLAHDTRADIDRATRREPDQKS